LIRDQRATHPPIYLQAYHNRISRSHRLDRGRTGKVRIIQLQLDISLGCDAMGRSVDKGRMAMLGLYVRQGTPWFADLRAELLSFPAGKHDDQVDALGLVGQLLDKISAGPRPKPPDLPQRDDYRAAFEEIPGDNWKTM
jgi:hypothetical protein